MQGRRLERCKLDKDKKEIGWIPYGKEKKVDNKKSREEMEKKMQVKRNLVWYEIQIGICMKKTREERDEKKKHRKALN